MITTNLFAKLFEVRSMTVDGKLIEYAAHPTLGTAAEKTNKDATGKVVKVEPLGWCPHTLIVFGEGKVFWNWYNTQTRRDKRSEFTVQSMKVKNTSHGDALLFVAGNRKFGLVITQKDDLWLTKINALADSFNTPAEEKAEAPTSETAPAPPKAASKPRSRKVKVEVKPEEVEQVDELRQMMEYMPC